MKREKMNARRFKALFKRQRIQEIASDGGNDLERPVKLVDICSAGDDNKCFESFDSQSMEDTEDGGHDCSKRVVDRLTDESIKGASEGALQDSTTIDDQAVVESHISVDCCLRDCLVGEPCSEHSHTKSSVRDMSVSPEKLKTNCPSARNKGPSESSQDRPINANCNEIIYHEGDAASASLMCKNCNLEGACLLCSKSKRGLSNVNGRELQFPSYKVESMELEFGEKSADEEHVEQQILTYQNATLKDKAGANEIYGDEVQKKCDKRMNKLILKQQRQIQEVLRIWENKKAELQKDHKLRSTIIRSIHGQSSRGMDKLKVLDDDLEMKIEDHNILKDVQLKNLEAEHLAVITQERQKAADWLASCHELRVIKDHQSLCFQSEDEAGGPQPRTFQIGGDGGKLPLTAQHLENENPSKCFSRQGNDAIPPVSSLNAPDDAISSENPVKTFVTVKSENKVGLESFAAVELLNQSMNFIDDREGVPENLPAPLEQVSNETKQVDPTKIAGQDQHGELSHPSGEEFKKVRKTFLSYDMVSSRSKPEMAVREGLHSAGPPSLHLERTIVSPDSWGLLLQKESDARGEENRSAPQIEMETSEPSDSVAPVPSNFESPITDNLTASEPFNRALVSEVSGQSHSLSADVSLSCKRSPATEGHEQGRFSSQTAEPEETEVGLHESISHTEENMEMNPVCLDAGPACGVFNEHNVELPGVLQNYMVIPQKVVDTPERPNRTVPLMVDIDAGNRHVSGFLVNPTHQPTYWNSSPSLSDPLQNQLEMIYKETEQLAKSHADMIAQLESDREKEIEEIISQISNRYEVKCQETEAQFTLKRNEHEKNHKKLLVNNMLADAFRSKCLENRPSANHAAALVVSDSSARSPVMSAIPPSTLQAAGR